MSREIHPIKPVYDESSRILILGSFPSVKSRADGFFYAHPRNRFWNVISAICGEALPGNTDEKLSLLLRHGIALWDVCAECDIQASSDAAIRNASANDIESLLAGTRISRIFTNGAAADRLYSKLVLSKTGLPSSRLPSTSPANASASLEALILEWSIIKEFII